uniref:Uncharacterized protein n=1 Tax=Chlorobaculum tepidum TaxID=1097 RepID=Q93SU3_CHLTP|nr:unknown [Chlorobaculum tepidum]
MDGAHLAVGYDRSAWPFTGSICPGLLYILIHRVDNAGLTWEQGKASGLGLLFLFAGRIVCRFVKLFFYFILSFFELLDTLAESFGQFGQLLSAEQEKDDEQNENEFLAA